MRAAVKAGHALNHAIAPSLDKVWERSLRWNHQYKGNGVFISTGPKIHTWPGTLRPGTFGAEDLVIDRTRVTVKLHITASAGLETVTLYDGAQVFRRFRPEGAETFEKTLYLSGALQRNVSVVARDAEGGKAVSYPLRMWKAGEYGAVTFCGDHVNDCGGVRLARGPSWPPFNETPKVPMAGRTWDGGPPAARPLLTLNNVRPGVRSDAGEQGMGAPPNQIPRLRFAD
jgi:hypothetical protein